MSPHALRSVPYVGLRTPLGSSLIWTTAKMLQGTQKGKA